MSVINYSLYACSGSCCGNGGVSKVNRKLCVVGSRILSLEEIICLLLLAVVIVTVNGNIKALVCKVAYSDIVVSSAVVCVTHCHVGISCSGCVIKVCLIEAASGLSGETADDTSVEISSA